MINLAVWIIVPALVFTDCTIDKFRYNNLAVWIIPALIYQKYTCCVFANQHSLALQLWKKLQEVTSCAVAHVYSCSTTVYTLVWSCWGNRPGPFFRKTLCSHTYKQKCGKKLPAVNINNGYICYIYKTVNPLRCYFVLMQFTGHLCIKKHLGWISDTENYNFLLCQW